MSCSCGCNGRLWIRCNRSFIVLGLLGVGSGILIRMAIVLVHIRIDCIIGPKFTENGCMRLVKVRHIHVGTVISVGCVLVNWSFV